MTITLDDVKAGKLRDDGHMNYGPNGSGWLMQHSTLPRLTCIDRVYAGPARQTAGLPFARLWCVDGVEVASLEAAIDALNVPPRFTDEERAVLEHVPADWVGRGTFSERVAGETGLPVGPVLVGLHQKGAIETALRPGEPFATEWIRRASGEGAAGMTATVGALPRAMPVMDGHEEAGTMQAIPKPQIMISWPGGLRSVPHM